MADDSKHFLSGRKVLVSGAGLGGLTFVLSLLKFWNAAIPAPEIVIVDTDGRDESINRWPYTLQLNAETEEGPLVGLRDLGLLDALVAKATMQTNPDANIHVWDKSWKSLMSLKPKRLDGFPTTGIRITRTALLTVLIEAVEAQTKITWGTSVTDAKRQADGKMRVSLLDKASGAASQEDCDLVVAADGDKSTLRSIYRPDDVNKSLGYVGIGGFAHYQDKSQLPEIVRTDSGIIVGGDGVASAVVHLDNNGKLLWSLFKEEKKPRGDTTYDKTDAAAFQALLDEARATAKNIAEPLPTLINQTQQDSSFVRPLVERDPFGHDGPELRGIVFIGEANRYVNAYIANGGGLAIRDGVNLAQELVAHKTLEAAVTAYDKAAVPRSTRSMKQGRQTMNTAHLSGWKWSVAKTALSAGGFLTGN